VRNFFQRLTTSSRVTEREAPALFDAETGDYLYEVNVSGTCPSCNLECSGNNCEDCGVPNMCVDLIDPVSQLSDMPPVIKDVRRWSLNMQASTDAILSHQARSRVPARIRELTQTVLSQPDLHIPITHPAEWGIRPTSEATCDQVFWVWPEMAYGFLYGIERLGGAENRDWSKDAPQDDWKIVHFFGYDNSVHHAILYPALYSAAYPDWTPDIEYHYNEFYLLDGLKFSTSRQHAIWGKEILNPDTVDAVRLYLSLTRPEVTRTNFNRASFDDFNRQVLIGRWDAWLADLGKIVQTDFGGCVPDAGDWSPEHTAFLAALECRRVALGCALGAQGFSLNSAASHLLDLVSDARRFAESQISLRNLEGQEDRWRTVVALQLAAALLLSRVASSVLPRFSASLSRALAQTHPPAWPQRPDLVEAGTRISLGTAPFFQPADAGIAETVPPADREGLRAHGK
jgi:methionyl-tRNA synthetase